MTPATPETQPTTETQPLTLDKDLSWVFCLIAQQKPKAVADMLMRESLFTRKEPFFAINGSLSAEENQLFSLVEWPGFDTDLKVLKKLISRLSFTQDPHLKSKQLKEFLKTSPLFATLDSQTILVTKEQVDDEGNPVTPLEHTRKVAAYPSKTTDMLSSDAITLELLKWTHDLGKMAAVNFLPDTAATDAAATRAKLEAEYGSDGKHSHPKHAYASAIIIHTLLLKINLEKAPSKVSSFLQDEDSVTLLLNTTFHHHHFLYSGEKNQQAVESWFWDEVTTQLLPTLPENRPDLVVRFMMLLTQFRLADIHATKSHHKHWQGNLEWMKFIPNILREKLDQTEQVPGLIDSYQNMLKVLPESL